MKRGRNARWRKRILRCAASAGLAGLVLGLALPVSAAKAADAARPERAAADTAYRGWVTIPAEDVVAEASLPEGGSTVAAGAEYTAAVTVTAEGDYALALTWRTDEDVILDSSAAVSVQAPDGTASAAVQTPIYSLWQDETKDYALDRYGNEITPAQQTLSEDVTDYVRDGTSLDLSPVSFSLAAGTQSVRFVNGEQALFLKKIEVVKLPDTPDYASYQSARDGAGYTGEPVVIEGENYAVKSDSFIRSKAEQNSGVTPYNPYYKWLATVDGNAWKTAGQRVVWNFTAPADGWYTITLHYSQSSKEGQEVYRDVEIDGAVPFEELKQVGFGYTGTNYAYEQPEQRVYLTKGKHTLGLYTEAPDTAPLIDRVGAVMDELSDIGLSLQQVAGGSADKTRSWEIEKYIPGVTQRLTDAKNALESLYKAQMELNGGKTPASSLNLKLATSILAQILEEPEKLPTRIEDINVGSGSVTNLLAEMVNKWKAQGLSIDRIYLTGAEPDLPAANGGFFVGLANGVKRFVHALAAQNANYGAGTVDSTALNIWVNRPVPYVETMQTLVDSRYEGFTDKNGNKISVTFSIMPDEGKLLLANASNTCPDVALSVTGDRPYQLGLRGAAVPLSDFSDFAEYVGGKFLSASLESYVYNGKVYGIPETQQFYVLMYRKDILSKMKLSVPKTWGELAEMMPALRRSGMNFYMPLSSWTGTKALSGIAPFFFQAASASGSDPDYSLWAKDGTRTTINSETGIQAFQTLTNLYRLYGLQNNMPSFYNNFRYGVTPLGVGDFGNYIQMLYAAPEIANQWAVAPVPGFEGTDGTIYNQMTTLDRSCMIMESSNKKDAAWDFLKWWMDGDTQAEFAQTLQTKFGSEFVWNSANRQAFAKLAIPSADREVILTQWNSAENFRNLPATYMLERSLSDAWYNVVQSSTPARIALNQAAADIEQELAIKLQEFGYLDGTGKVLRPVDMRSLTKILGGES